MLTIPQPGLDAAERRAGWHNLIEVFSDSFRGSFANDGLLDLGAIRDALGAWEDFAGRWDGQGLLDHPSTLDELERMLAMLWCADYVRSTTAGSGDVTVGALTELPPSAPCEVRDRADWSLAFIRLLQGEEPVKRIGVPVALADELVQLKGGIATLVLDVYSPGAGRLTFHPEESFRMTPDVDFTESLGAGWQIALETARSDKKENEFPDIVWRVIRESPTMSGLDEKAFYKSSGLRLKGQIKGRSASGAAARGFYHALMGTNPDPDVFVLAQVPSTEKSPNQLQGVSGITAKVEAIADTGKDAVIIVTERDKAEADLAVSKKHASARVEIVLIESNSLPALYTARSKTGPPSAKLKLRIDKAGEAAQRHDTEKAISLWEEARKQAENENNEAVTIRAQFEVALMQLYGGADLEEVVSVLDKCLHDARSIDLGDDRVRLLQILGEAHRLGGNPDQARGFTTSALEHSRSRGYKLQEGWALLLSSALERANAKRAVSHAGLDTIQLAYNCFSSVYASGGQEEQRKAKEGFAACHMWRARIYDRLQLDDALSEFARALKLYSDLGEDFEWDAADVLFQRGDLHSRADDPQLAGKDLVAAADLFMKLGDCLMGAKCILGMAELLDRRGWRLESKQYYESAAAIAIQQKDRKAGAWILFRYAMKLIELDEVDKAEAILKSLLASDHLPPGQTLDVLKMLSMSAKVSGQEEKLEQYSTAALEIIDNQIAAATSPDERRRLIFSKANCLDELGQHDRAMECYRRVIDSCDAIGDKEVLIMCWSQIAQGMENIKKRKEAREAYEEILDLIGDDRDSFHRPMTLTMIAQLDIFEERFDEARKNLDLAEQEKHLLDPMIIMIIQDLRSKLPPMQES